MVRVIGSQDINSARSKGLAHIEVLPGDIVTDLGREAASRLGIELKDGPLERPVYPRTDGTTQMRRHLYRRNPHWVAPQTPVHGKARQLGKIALVGAGGVGANIAHLLANQNASQELVLIDVAAGVAAATALDLEHATGISGSGTRMEGSSDLKDVADADLVVVTAGRPRTPGMSRSDLIDVNKRVIHAAGEATATLAPKAIVIVVTNPLDEMTYEMLNVTGFPRERVLGMAGTLDSSRFRACLAKAAGVCAADVSAMALGSHGDEMVPLSSQATIKGRALAAFLSEEQIAACINDAVTGGGQVVALRKTGSATLAPAHATVEIIDHLRGARAGLVPVSVLLQGELELEDVVLGMPCRLGQGGLLDIVVPKMSADEGEALKNAAAAVRSRIAG